MALPVAPPVAPMLAQLQGEIPRGDGWRYEPKWDGFRALVFRDERFLHLQSRKQQPLERYFPELVDVFLERIPARVVLDGEIIIPGPRGLDFDALLQRIHPATSRVKRLARETPASFVAFDVLALGDTDLRGEPFDRRRAVLAGSFDSDARCLVTPQTLDVEEAARWFERFEGAGLDGVIAKRGEIRYVEGDRVMVKVKHERTAECVVGGYRVAKDGKGIGSLLLGLYDDDGLLHRVGFTSAFNARDRAAILEKVRPLEGGGGFTGRAPGGPSRWADRDTQWVPLDPVLVCEVAFDHVQGDRFRHGTRFLRWRPDKDPRECTYEQLEPPRPFSLDDVVRLARRAPAAG